MGSKGTAQKKRDADFALEVRASRVETLRRRGEPYNLLASLFALGPRLWRCSRPAARRAVKGGLSIDSASCEKSVCLLRVMPTLQPVDASPR